MDELSPIKIGPLFCRSVRLYLPSRHHGEGSYCTRLSQHSRQCQPLCALLGDAVRRSHFYIFRRGLYVLLQFTSPMQSRRVHQKVYVAHYVVFTPSWFAIQPQAIQRPRTTSAGHNGRKVHLKPLGPNSKIGLSGLATVFSAIHCCSAGILLIGKNPMAISEDFVFSKTALILLIVLLKKFN